jgi:pyruvate-ferredoxin/flavodoxin oxidoreductase
MPAEDAKNYPEVPFLDMTGMPGYKFAVSVSPLDCYGCGSCVNVCPGKKGAKALVMKSAESQLHKQEFFKEAYKYADSPEVLAKFKPDTVKAASSNSRCLSSRAHARDAAKHRTQS